MAEEELPDVETIKEEWDEIDSMQGPMTGTKYSTYISPDRKLVAQIHEFDDELVALIDREDGRLIHVKI